MEEKSTIISVDIVDLDHSEFRFNYSQSKSHSTWLDWGDGSQREAYDKEGSINVVHEYSEPGLYEIKLFAVDEGKIELISIDPNYRGFIMSVVIGDDVTSVSAFCFADCDNLEELKFEGESIDIGSYCFSNCSSLMSVEMPSGLGAVPEGMFFNCSSLRTCELPNGVSVVSDNAFYGCSQLRSIDLKAAYEIGNYTFHGCRKLTSIAFGSGIRKIGNGAFDSCTSVRSLSLGAAKTIGDRAFCNCRYLTKVSIPETVDSIGDEAFYNCHLFKEINVESITPPTLAGTKTFPDNKNYKIIVPRGRKRDYAYATNWNLYLDQMEEAR